MSGVDAGAPCVCRADAVALLLGHCPGQPPCAPAPMTTRPHHLSPRQVSAPGGQRSYNQQTPAGERTRRLSPGHLCGSTQSLLWPEASMFSAAPSPATRAAAHSSDNPPDILCFMEECPPASPGCWQDCSIFQRAESSHSHTGQKVVVRSRAVLVLTGESAVGTGVD